MSTTQNDSLQAMYREGEAVRMRFEGDRNRALSYYRRYVDFVKAVHPPHNAPQLLDIGCGAGWSSYILAQEGYRVTGGDLNPDAFEPPPTQNLTLQQASVMELPFEDEAFDLITIYQTIEHVPDTRRSLEEMMRVCRPGGTICIVGPNILSIAPCVRGLIKTTWKNRPAHSIFVRVPGMQRHPFGNTIPENLAMIPVNLGRIAGKLLSSEARFDTREPDLTPPFNGDNDAVYLCNPIDFLRYFPGHGFDIVRNGALGRPSIMYPFVAGTWIAARKRNAS